MAYRALRYGALEGGLWLPGIAGNLATTPDDPSLGISGDLDIRWHGKLDDVGATQAQLLSKWGTPGERSFALTVIDTKFVRFMFSADGSVNNVRQSLERAPIVAGVPIWLRATLDADNEEGGHTVRFYSSSNGNDWSELGAPVVTVGAASIHIGSSSLSVGNTGDLTSGRGEKGVHYEVQVRDGIDGPLVAHPVFRHPVTAFTVDGTTSHDGHRLWTLQGQQWEWRP